MLPHTLWPSEPFDTRCARAQGGSVRLSRFLLRPLGVGVGWSVEDTRLDLGTGRGLDEVHQLFAMPWGNAGEAKQLCCRVRGAGDHQI